jgi:hypothetical protein
MADTEEPISVLAERVAKGETLTKQQQERLALYVKQNEEEKKSLEFQEKRTREIKTELELLNDVNNKLEIANKSRQAEALIKEAQLKIEKELLVLDKQRDDLNKAKEELEAARVLGSKEEIEAAQKKVDLARQEFDITNRRVDKLKDEETFKRAGAENSLNFINALGVRTEEQDNSMTKMFRGIMRGGDDAKSVFEGFSAGLHKLNPENIALSLLSKTIESTIMMVKMADQTFASFNKTIGTTGELNNEIYELSSGNAKLGFTLQETAQAYTALAGGFVDFRGLSQQNRTELAQTVAELQAIGISSDIATKNISFFSKAMGLSTQESISLSKELVATAGALEMAPSKISSDFAAAASSMVVYGNRAIEVFKGLEAASKASGVEVSNLISIASKMDTFQGAAEVAGKLNAVLGGGLLNSSQLLMASEEERIRLVIQSVQSQGVQFNDLDKYTQKAIANAAGITDMAEANKLFGMSVDAYDDYIAKTAASSEEQANLEERIQASKSAQEKFNYIIQSFAVLVMPLLNGITAIINAFMELNQIVGGILPQLLTIGATGAAIFMKWESIALTLGEIFSAVFTFVIEGGLITIGTVFSEVIVPIAAAIGLMYLLYKAFFDGKNAVTEFLDKYEAFRTILYLIAAFSVYPLIAAFKILGSVLTGIYDYVLTPVGHFLMWIGRGLLYVVALANPFFKAINDGFASFLKLLHLRNSPALYEMPLFLAEGFRTFANVIISLVVPALNILMAPLKTIGSLMSGVFHAISSIFGSTSQLFGKENVVGIKANFDATEALATTAAKITPDSMTNVKQLAAEVQKFNMELKTMATVTASEPLMNLVKAITGQTNAVTDGTKDKTIVLKVGEREFGKIVLDTINKKGNIDTAVKSTSTVT